MGRFSAAERRRRWPPTKRSGGFTSGPISGWTKIVEADGNPAEASDEARAEANPYSVITAGDQTAADVDVGISRSAQPGSRRESAPRRGAYGRAAGRRSHARAQRKRRKTEGQHQGLVGRCRLRILFRRLPRRRLPSARAAGSKRAAAD